jgi:AhpD family alkylhydroperoxidase
MTARLPPLPRQEWTELLTRLVERMPGGLERPMNIFTTLARHPVLFEKWLPFGAALLRGELPARERELVILRTAYRRRCGYERAQHLPLARRAGLDEAEIAGTERALDGYPGSAADRLVLGAVDELTADGELSDGTWDALARRYTESQLIELVMLVGHYQLLALTLNTLRVEVEEPLAE